LATGTNVDMYNERTGSRYITTTKGKHEERSKIQYKYILLGSNDSQVERFKVEYNEGNLKDPINKDCSPTWGYDPRNAGLVIGTCI